MAKVPPELQDYDISGLARICRVSLKTAGRWKAGQTVPPQTALMILRRDLGCFDPGWAGWRISGESLVAPFGAWPVRRDDALAVPLMHAQIDALRRDIERLKKELEEARSGRSEQPHPDTWVLKIG